MSKAAQYGLPEGILGLKGPMVRPEPGTLPLRGDLAHIALADRYLVPHYVIPQFHTVGSDPVALKLEADAHSDTVTTLDAGSTFEVLDVAGDWCWGCVSADGPSGYVPKDSVTPQSV
ncbi:hypothetical protein [Pontixanthobacter sp. CEM42]|uniref:hypothetical protein n=1 Tax=Pontixanthobacter sp. CEM42 TaxID=2792077 RepID=UPI0032AF6DCE